MNLLILLVPLLMVLPAQVDAGQEPHLASAKNQFVSVIDADRREWQGRLIEWSNDSLTIDGESGTQRFPLSQVRRVDADGDSVRDGLIKGALFGFLVGMLAAEATHDGGVLVGSIATYAAIGAGIDALNRCRHTVYRGPAPQVAFRVSW